MKNYRVILMPTAEEGLLEIGEYIALDNPVRAISFIDELTEHIKDSLSIFPKFGRVYDDLESDLEIRSLPYGNYISYYIINEQEKKVEVLFIFNAKRNISKLLTDLIKEI